MILINKYYVRRLIIGVSKQLVFGPRFDLRNLEQQSVYVCPPDCDVWWTTIYFNLVPCYYSLQVQTVNVARDHNHKHHTQQDSSGQGIGPSQRPLPDSTQHSQETNIHALSGIRTRSSNMRAPADLSLRPCGVAYDYEW